MYTGAHPLIQGLNRLDLLLAFMAGAWEPNTPSARFVAFKPLRKSVLESDNTMSLDSDRALLDAFRRGEQKALQRVYTLHANQVARFLRRGFTFESGGKTARFRGARSELEVEDWVHDVFVRAFSDGARAQYDGLRPYGPYLERIARNLVLDELRRKEHRLRAHVEQLPESSEVEAEYAPSRPQSPEGAAEERQLADHVAAYLETLNEREQTVYQLRFVEGLEQKDVARKAGLSASKVKTSERRIRDGFYIFLSKHGWLEGRSLTTYSTPRSDKEMLDVR